MARVTPRLADYLRSSPCPNRLAATLRLCRVRARRQRVVKGIRRSFQRTSAPETSRQLNVLDGGICATSTEYKNIRGDSITVNF